MADPDIITSGRIWLANHPDWETFEAPDEWGLDEQILGYFSTHYIAAYDAVLARAEAVEANLARAREIMKPFAAVGELCSGLADAREMTVETHQTTVERDRISSPGYVRAWNLTAGHFRAVSRLLTEGEGT